MIIFSLFREFNAFSIENFIIILNLGPLQRMSRMTKHVGIPLPVKFARKPELTLTLLLGYRSLLVNRPLSAGPVTGKPTVCPGKWLSETGHCPLTGRYFEPWG